MHDQQGSDQRRSPSVHQVLAAAPLPPVTSRRAARGSASSCEETRDRREGLLRGNEQCASFSWSHVDEWPDGDEGGRPRSACVVITKDDGVTRWPRTAGGESPATALAAPPNPDLPSSLLTPRTGRRPQARSVSRRTVCEVTTVWLGAATVRAATRDSGQNGSGAVRSAAAAIRR